MVYIGIHMTVHTSASVTIYQIFWWPSIIKSEVTVRSFLDMKRDEVLKKMASIFVDVRGHCYNWMDVRFKLIHKKEYLCKLQIFYFSLETMPRIDAFDVLRKDTASRVLKIFHVLWCLVTKIKETKIILRNIYYSPQSKKVYLWKYLGEETKLLPDSVFSNSL